MRVHFCPSCGKPFIIHPEVVKYLDKIKLSKLICGNCGGLVPNNTSLGRLVAISGADYIEDLGKFDE